MNYLFSWISKFALRAVPEKYYHEKYRKLAEQIKRSITKYDMPQGLPNVTRKQKCSKLLVRYFRKTCICLTKHNSNIKIT